MATDDLPDRIYATIGMFGADLRDLLVRHNVALYAGDDNLVEIVFLSEGVGLPAESLTPSLCKLSFNDIFETIIE